MLDDSSARTTTPRRIWVAPMVAAVLGAVVAGGTVGGVMQGRISDARDAAIAVETAAHESLEAVEGEAREARYERDSLRRSLASVVEARDAAFEEAEAAEGKLDEKDAEIKRLKREVAAAPEKSTASEPSDETDRPRDVTKAARAAAGDHVVRAVEDSPGHVVSITMRFDVHRMTVWTHTEQTAPKPLSPRPTVYYAVHRATRPAVISISGTINRSE